MNRENKILFRVILFLTLLFFFSPVIYADSDQNIPITIVKHSVMENCGENNLFSEIDFSDDEQINQILDFFPESESKFKIRISQNCIVNSNYPTSIWQPPKKMFGVNSSVLYE